MLPRLQDSGVIGQFRTSIDLLLIATQAAGSLVFSLRWTDPDTFLRIDKLKLRAIQNVAATATIFPRYDAWIARNWTVSDTAGAALTPNSGKKNIKQPNTKIATGDMRGSISLAAGLTSGTKTLDTHPILTLNTNLTITTPNPAVYSNDLELEAGEYPFVLKQNEGLVILNENLFGAAGQAELLVELAWTEITGG